MALDAIFLSFVVKELRSKCVGAKIDKIQQPERDKIILSLRTRDGSAKLLIDAQGGSGRIGLTRESFENPAQPPMFCMLLRKYLTGGRITRIEQPSWDRLVMVYITSRSELGDDIELCLAAELMGRSANLALIDAEGRIIDCLRRTDFGGDADRRMLPGMIYRLPPKQKKPLVMDLSPDEIREIINNSDPAAGAEKCLMSGFSGLSPLLCRELACRCGGSFDLLPDAVCALIESVKAGEGEPVLYSDEGKPAEFSFMFLRQYDNVYTAQVMQNFSELLDTYYSRRDAIESRRRRAKELRRTVQTAHKRIAKKLALQKEELKKCSGRDELRKQAELLTANLYRVKKGDGSVTVADYYEPDQPEIVIKLDPLKTPQANAAAMFKEYNKLKAAEAHLTGLIAEGEKQLEYLGSVLDEIDRAETGEDLAEIKSELTQTGYIKKPRSGKERRQKKNAPLRFMSSDGFEILVGRSNAQNDELTTKIARRTDIWLHTKLVHGSHVIISCLGEEPPERTIEEAAQIAAYYSQAREGGKTQVDYTMVRNVRKPSGALPGKVVYVDYKTISAEPDEALCARLAVK